MKKAISILRKHRHRLAILVPLTLPAAAIPMSLGWNVATQMLVVTYVCGVVVGIATVYVLERAIKKTQPTKEK